MTIPLHLVRAAPALGIKTYLYKRRTSIRKLRKNAETIISARDEQVPNVIVAAKCRTIPCAINRGRTGFILKNRDVVVAVSAKDNCEVAGFEVNSAGCGTGAGHSERCDWSGPAMCVFEDLWLSVVRHKHIAIAVRANAGYRVGQGNLVLQLSGWIAKDTDSAAGTCSIYKVATRRLRLRYLGLKMDQIHRHRAAGLRSPAPGEQRYSHTGC